MENRMFLQYPFRVGYGILRNKKMDYCFYE